MKAALALGVALMLSVATHAAESDPASDLAAKLTPQPQCIVLGDGAFAMRGADMTVSVPEGEANEACRAVLIDALSILGARPTFTSCEALRFTVGDGVAPPPMSHPGPDAYSLAISAGGVTARAGSPSGLLYAAETFRQLCRVYASAGRLPCLTIDDWPDFPLRGMYIEGGQERFGRIVEKGYLLEQIRRLAEFKMNALIIECYNLFPFASFPYCADASTLSREDCSEIVAEAKRYHVTLIPSLQTLAQAYELVWNNDAGKPYREPTAPGMMCPSTPAIYPFIKGLYRDLLTLFDTSPIMGIGCSEIDMQWRGRYCPKCKARIDAGETVRDIMVGHAVKCIGLVHELSKELGRPIRPMMWGDEFYMYGPGRDWVDIDRIPTDTVMGFWKYWRDYSGIEGLMKRGYDVLGVSAMYNDCFYLADISPQSPKKLWEPMAQTGILNITEMVQTASEAQAAHPRKPRFWGTVTASFSKHRLRAFDTIWYGFALNGQCTWSHSDRPIASYQHDFTAAFARHYYDCRTDHAAATVASAWTILDDCKSQLELANQTLHDVVGVYDTQEPGFVGNTFLGAWQHCRDASPDKLAAILKGAEDVQARVARVQASLKAAAPDIHGKEVLANLQFAGEKIAAHAQREELMIDTQALLAKKPPASEVAPLATLWSAAEAREQRIADHDAHLYTQGDPCGDLSLLRDLRTIEDHLADLAKASQAHSAGKVLLDEAFASLDPSRWKIEGHPKLADGQMETTAPGGWGKHSGISTKQALPLDDAHTLVVDFNLTPVKMGVDSQLVTSATDEGGEGYRFAFYGPNDHFGVYTKSSTKLAGPWVDTTPGWHLRAQSSTIEAGKTYHVRLEITPTTFRAIVHREGDTTWDMPLWDTSPIPMDRLASTRLLFCDVEPEGSTATSRWSHLIIRRISRAH